MANLQSWGGGGDFHGVNKLAAVWCWSVQLRELSGVPEQKILICFPPEQKKESKKNGPDPLLELLAPQQQRPSMAAAMASLPLPSTAMTT